MSLRGIIIRLVYIALTTWVLIAIIESFGWGLYFALLPLIFFEMLRPRPAKNNRQPRLKEP